MAGDWTPIEHATPRKPEVMKLVTLSSRSRHEVVGLLVDFWCWADENTDNGNLDVPLTSLPHLIGADELFWRAVESIGWIVVEGDKIRIPNAGHWLTTGAKSRLMTTRRQQKWRGRVTPTSRRKRDKTVTKTSTTEQNRTEHNTPLPPSLDFPEFRQAWDDWKAYRKEARKPLTPRSEKMQIKQLAAMGRDAVFAIERSIANGYQGIFPPKDGKAATVKQKVFDASTQLYNPTAKE